MTCGRLRLRAGPAGCRLPCHSLDTAVRGRACRCRQVGSAVEAPRGVETGVGAQTSTVAGNPWRPA